MSLVDMSDAIALLASGLYVVTRRAATTFTAGRRNAPTTSTFSVVGSLQPMKGVDIARLPEGLRTKDSRVLFSSTQLRAAQSDTEPDSVAIDGATYQVETAEPWSELGNYWRCVLVRSDR